MKCGRGWLFFEYQPFICRVDPFCHRAPQTQSALAVVDDETHNYDRGIVDVLVLEQPPELVLQVWPRDSYALEMSTVA
jgi:hypothetical protein